MKEESSPYLSRRIRELEELIGPFPEGTAWHGLMSDGTRVVTVLGVDAKDGRTEATESGRLFAEHDVFVDAVKIGRFREVGNVLDFAGQLFFTYREVNAAFAYFKGEKVPCKPLIEDLY